MIPFPIAWSKVCCRDGWLSEGEGAVLYAYASSLRPGSRIVEIGAYQGRSTLLLAQTGHSVTAVDPLTPGYGDGNNMLVREEHAARFQNAISDYPNVQWLRCPSADIRAFSPTVDLLYIDGDHRHPNPLADFRHVRYSLSPEALVIWHDYDKTHPAVAVAADYLLQSQQLLFVAKRGSLLVTKLPTLEPEDRTVTGFNLFVLNHKFSSRCTAFARSLAEQIDVGVPIHVSVFHNRAEDTEPFHQLSDTRITREMVFVECEKAVDRAAMFSLHIPKFVFSHVIYTDCDIVFPPNFFRQYRELLESSNPGYWSAYIEEIQQDDAEMLLEQGVVTETNLDRYAVGPRYDWGHGTAGHFQCAPHKIASYPCSKVKGVSQADDQFARWAIAQSLDNRKERRLGATAYHLGHPFSWFGTEVEL